MSSIRKNYWDRIEYRNEQGYLHRKDGPARIWTGGENKGEIEWIINGKYHREDGPAVEYSYGTKAWYLNGTRYFEDEWLQEVAKIKLKRILEL
jgi:hypothetical protein